MTARSEIHITLKPDDLPPQGTIPGWWWRLRSYIRNLHDPRITSIQDLTDAQMLEAMGDQPLPTEGNGVTDMATTPQE